MVKLVVLPATTVVGEIVTGLKLFAALPYGPTIGPPLPPEQPRPAGRHPVPTSAMARSIWSRPFPVCSTVPAASAVRARRPTMTPFEADGSFARSSAAAAATAADEADVPVTEVVPPPGAVVMTPTPGAARNTSGP